MCRRQRSDDGNCDGWEQIGQRRFLPSLFNGTFSGDRYLEAALSNWNGGGNDPEAPWASRHFHPIGLNHTNDNADTVGSGAANTAVIVTAISGESGRAAQLYDSYEDANDQDDWHLPSIGELWLLSNSQNIVGSNYYVRPIRA